MKRLTQKSLSVLLSLLIVLSACTGLVFAASTYNLYIQICDGTDTTLTLEAESTDLISTLKTMINNQTKIPVAKQTLVYNNSVLEDNKTLSDCSIPNGSTLRLIPYVVGDSIFFGTFPQSEVTDTKLMGKLADAQKNWKSAGYYSGTGSWDDGKMTASDYMQYADFIYDNAGYRAIQFTKYRPSQSGGVASPTSGNGSGYATDFIYYFKFEPIEWIVLDPANGLVMSKKLLDAQAYQNLVKKNDGKYYTGSSYANNYEKSSLRAYLNGAFYNAAFSTTQQSSIVETSYSYASYGSSAATPAVKDAVTVLSYDDCLNTAYGFKNTINADSSLVANEITAYAKSQAILDNNGKAEWWLRTPDTASGQASCVTATGALNHAATVNMTNKGVRPVITLSAIHSDTSLSLSGCPHNNGTITFDPVAATCTQEGHTGYTICKDCSAVISGENTVIPAKGHVDKKMLSGEDGSDGWCDECGAELTLHLDNSGSLQLSGPLQSLMDLIRKLVAKVESLFTMLNSDKDKKNDNTSSESADSSDSSVDLSDTGKAFDSFADLLGTLINSFKGISDQKSAEKEADRNSFIDFLQNYGNEDDN